jgi:hypothetical protein
MNLAGPTWSPERVRFPEDRSLFYRARSMFYRPGEEDYVDWLCGQNPAGPVYCWLAMDGDTIAGQYMAIPLDVVADGVRVKACLSIDTFTNVNYRKQGIFVTLAERVYADAEADGCRFTFGIPNENSRPGFLKNLKFTEPFGLYSSAMPLPFRKLAGNRFAKKIGAAWCRAGSPFERDLQITSTAALDPDWGDALWDKMRLKSQWGQWKDGEWLEWRFSLHPKCSYRLLRAEDSRGNPSGYLAWRRDPRPEKEHSRVWIMDVDGVNAGVRLALIRHLVREVAPEADWIMSFHTPLSRYGRPLTLSGMVPVRKMNFIFRPHGRGTTGFPDFTGRSCDISPASADWM